MVFHPHIVIVTYQIHLCALSMTFIAQQFVTFKGFWVVTVRNIQKATYFYFLFYFLSENVK